MPCLLLAMVVALAVPPSEESIAILPPVARFEGTALTQRFLVEARDGDRYVGDRTAQASFATSNPAVATVDSDGTVTPKGNGIAIVTARIGDQSATATVEVTGAGAPPSWSFRNHVLPVLTKAGCNSGACHGAAAGKNGLRLTLRGYAPEVDYDVLTRQALGRRVVRTAPAESLLLLKPTGALEHGGGVKFARESLEYRVIAEWIGGGITPPSDADPTVTRLSLYPPTARLRPGDRQSVVVLAHDSAGRVVDVTRWARFEATDATVAKVDDTGAILVVGAGEAAVSVGYANQVALVTVTVPTATPPDPRVFAEAPRANSIDELNLAKLADLGIPPSPPCDDATFLRRAYLDATGTLPPAVAVDSFLADADPAKRVRLIDVLLASEEAVDYWTYKWSDLLLVSSKNLPAPAMWSFYRFIRRSVADNRPWDEFARAIVTAKGSTLADGAANYYAIHRDPVALTENASMAFLGMSITCARCHNHPLEKWTQDQYYGMANLFGRVKLKDGGSAGDVIVATAADGDVLHPRKGTAMAPQPLDAAALPLDGRGDRREALADWLASPNNPYFARAIVNRVWRNYFGRGLIEPEDDLRATNPPSDARLMDWLVDDLRAHDYDLRHLARTIMNSAAYQRSSGPVAGNEADTKYLSHYLVKRLGSEVLLDAISGATGAPTEFPGYPARFRSLQLPDSQVASSFLAAFGRPERLSTCSCERSAEPSVAQALHLANGGTLNDKLRAAEGAVATAAASGSADPEIIADLYRAALGRPPTADELGRLSPILAGATRGIDDPKEKVEARRQAIEDLYWATLTSQEFLFNH